MLVKIIDHKNRERCVNAAYIKALHARGDETDIEVSGWGMKVRVKLPIDEVAAAVNAAMDASQAHIAAEAAALEGEVVQQQQQTAAIAVIG